MIDENEKWGVDLRKLQTLSMADLIALKNTKLYTHAKLHEEVIKEIDDRINDLYYVKETPF